MLMNNWEDFGTKANADAYDKNIRWLASHPWIEIVTPDQIVERQGGHQRAAGWRRETPSVTWTAARA